LKNDLLFEKRLGYDELTVPLADPYVEEVECKGFSYPVTVVHRIVTRFPRLYTNIVFEQEDHVLKVIEKLANKADKPVSIAKPYLEFSLPEAIELLLRYLVRFHYLVLHLI